MIHKIKIREDFADAVLRGDKAFEIRENDRGYQRGDLLRFKAVDKLGIPTEHPINGATYEVTYVLSGWGIKEGYVALSIAPHLNGEKGE